MMKKRLIVLTCLCSLIIGYVVAVGEYAFIWRQLKTPCCQISIPVHWRLEDSALAQARPGFTRYQQGTVSFSYPAGWEIWSEAFSGGEILEHVGFRGLNKKSAHGFVQVWLLERPLDQFLREAEHSPIYPTELISFKISPRQVAGLSGYLLEYNRQGIDGQIYRAREVFCQQEDKMYRLSYFVQLAAPQEQHQKIFDRLVDSLRIINP